MFKCPRCNKECETLRGWSRHTNSEHGGCTPQEREAAIEGASLAAGSAQSGFQSFDDAAAQAPLTDAPEPKEEKAKRARKTKEPTAEEKRIEEMRTAAGEVCAKLTQGIISSKLGIQLANRETETIQAGWTSFFSAIGISLEFEKLDIKITSPWILLILPLFSVLLVLSSHIAEITAKIGGEESEQGNGNHRS